MAKAKLVDMVIEHKCTSKNRISVENVWIGGDVCA